jgi:hypothetical protein
LLKKREVKKSFNFFKKSLGSNKNFTTFASAFRERYSRSKKQEEKFINILKDKPRIKGK